MVLTLLYALGKYTPVFHLIYDFVPGVTLYRRPADATFVFCALLAIARGLSRPSLADRYDAAAAALAARGGDFDCRCADRHRDRPRAVGRRAAKRRAADPLGHRICRWRRSPR